MTILGGMLVDRYGTNKTSLLFSTFVLFGTLLTHKFTTQAWQYLLSHQPIMEC